MAEWKTESASGTDNSSNSKDEASYDKTTPIHIPVELHIIII